MNDKSQVEYVLDDIRTIVDNVIIKLSNIADEYETADIKREADRYIAAYMERDNFNSYKQYPIDVLVNAGITDINIIMEYSQDKNKIPRNKRKEVLKYMRKQIVNEYVEQNDYYRELIGMPSINTPESEYIYLTEDEMKYYNIDEVRPIHDYPKEIQIKLERMAIPRLIEEYPERTYLQHMGSKSVDLVRAREAKNFEIIYTDAQLDIVFMRAFFNTYDFCREYFMSMIYNKQFKARYDLYDNYIGMHIMIMTIQRLIVDTIKMCIDRDFYDLISIQKLFNVYGLPFYEDLPLDYQRMICKNVNWLLRCKSTDKVLYDVANTLFYERIDIHKYYLIKDRQFDDDGEPIFIYKYVATDDKYDEDTMDYYIRSTNGKVFKLCITNGVFDCMESYDVLDYYVKDAIYIKDKKNDLIHKIFVEGNKVVKKIVSGNFDFETEIIIYDEENKSYEITINKNEININKLYNDFIEIDCTDVEKNNERTYLKSNDGKVYELKMKGDVLVTEITTPASDFVNNEIRIIDEHTGEKAILFMNGSKIASKPADDEFSAQPLYLYNEKNERFRIYTYNNKLQSVEYNYRIKKVYDYEKMYTCYFQSVELLEDNVAGAIEQKKFRYSYEEVTEDDVYWWDTEELKKELYEREYNYIDTKYIGVNLMQNLTKLMYESCYYLNLLVDHKDTTVPLYQRIFNSDAMKTGTDYLYVTLDRITTTPISIFDTVMVLCALVSKKNGMKGNIIVKSPAQILSVLGFNFEANFDLIRENIKKYKRVFKNQDILKYLDLLDIRSVKDIDTLYNNFRNFAEFCEDVLANTTDINEYKAYKELYKVISVRKDMTDLFTISDGTVAETYLDYLYDKLPKIAEFIDELHKDKTGIYIEHAIGKLNELIPEIEYLYSINGTNNNIINAIIGLINFFKSYTVDIRNLNVMYICDNKRMNKIYMINDPRLFITLFPEDEVPKYVDSLKYCTKFDKYDNLIIYRKAGLFNKIVPKHKFNTDCRIQSLSSGMRYEDNLELMYKDMIEVYNYIGDKDYVEISTFKALFNDILNKDKFNTEGFITLYRLMNIPDNMDLQYKDLIANIINKDRRDIKLKIDELYQFTMDIFQYRKYITDSKLYFTTKMDREYVLGTFDDIVIKNLNYLNNKIVMNILQVHHMMEILEKTKMELKDFRLTCINYDKEDKMFITEYSDSLLFQTSNPSKTSVYINDSLKLIYED